ncbi:MAG: hypothetical protein ABMA13_13320 [Chthoniobacteraceae bacterium]
MRLLLRLVSVALAALTIPACVHPCDAKRSDTKLKSALLPRFEKSSEKALTRSFDVYRSRRSRSGPPVLLLHEIPALSGSVLDLADRLGGKGYDVYVPLLWGSIDDDARSKSLAIRRLAWSVFSRDWRTIGGRVDRGIVGEMHALIVNRIARDHPGEPISVIGNCISGPVPLALAARMPRTVVAPVLSQPASPFYPKADSGISPVDMERIRSLARRGDAPQVLVYRFECDSASPSVRLARLKCELGSDCIIDGTIPASLYVEGDQMNPRSHSVLSGCYLDGKPRSTRHAWNELLRFLDAKLRHEKPRRFKFKPYPG